MAKAAHFYARLRRLPKLRARFTHRHLVADRDDADPIDIAPTPPGHSPEQLARPG